MSALLIRPARRDDVPHIVALLADDTLGSGREHHEMPLPSSYYEAFEAIAADPHNELIVGEAEGRVVGTLQMTIIPGLTYQGGTRALIEAVRVAADQRGHGVGAQLVQWVIERARTHGCRLVQLTTDKRRPDALRFYESLGFRATHEGLKLHL